MNALQTFEQQIKEYGTLFQKNESPLFDYVYYMVDDETYAVVVYDKEGNIDHATFDKIKRV